MTTPQADPLIGRLVDGRYRVRARIARGGMATVYVATDMRLERRIALKVMHAHLSDDSAFQSRFIQEARAAARLADPHVVNVFDQGQDGELAYLVMEYLPGITLRELMREQKRLTVPQTITIMDAVLSGLAAAHSAGIVHRDVKPENVLLAEDGRIKIGDFGLARATTANTATGAQLLGTIAYLAPELVTRGTADARSDIYALGIMLYEMLVGEQPYKGEQPMQIAYQHATEQVPRPSTRNTAVPEQLDELVLWATEKSPDDRPLDAGAMLTRLREIERDLGIAPVVTTTAAVHRDHDSGAVTKILPGVITADHTEDVPVDADNAARLRRRTSRRRARGALLLSLVLLLAVSAGGVGWWFGSGPGSLVGVPSVAGMSYDDAAAVVTAEGLIPERTDKSSVDVDEGDVIESRPGAGERVEQDSTVTLVVSSGPAQHTLPHLGGKTEQEVRDILTANNVNVEDDTASYFADLDRDLVLNVRITPRGSDESYACGTGCDVFEDDTALIQMSLGPVPDVTGKSLDDAISTLSDAGLKVADERPEEFSDSVAAGAVIRQSTDRPGGGSWRPGDALTLTLSKGPQLFKVPDVAGLTRDEARQKLEDAGFTVDYAPFWNGVPNGLTKAQSTDPESGTMHRAGTEIYIVINVSG
ncbi:Stk1 family PASTA domain-containing Ser/Thr kinase [Microbacterium esteraromaticum]|uniref:Stk1 family PASTA domain-containing Ser/Thr kinase n=1 Tax=Microbacterium esteraromaticum TaxID=57043 RepID=UPI001C98345A|nr:Stk1 family PASTA domain-containing Ser/Thr kinase [Microbacterium esteraromaticum]MBY6062332.1 Stk1 family PASTA domain-containing Ser/Thr kinase [Microbacterium esteraromaticum]